MPKEKAKQLAPVIVKKKGKHDGHHGGAWKVAYADFVTAMMAFFLVMWIVGQSEQVKQSVAGYFNDPVGFKKNKNSAVLKGAGPSVIDKKKLSESERLKEEAAAKNKLEKARNEIMAKLEQLPEFKMLKENIEIEMTAEGLRIQLIESSNKSGSTFYDLGSMNLNNEGKAILTAITKELVKLDNNVVLEGHTDSRAYVLENTYSNWELSTDRANGARKLMEDTGLARGRIEAVRGYADKRPRISENPLDPRNRRISIIVLNDYAELRYKELQSSDWIQKRRQ
ncbi:MAG: hypothetical protein CO189_07900 [candidate division Zixibacteria bacterium CG_4_9_14_3_um_filter_46_8]|nr:MAG: hypothetical protein CO189_07900 [candidate division Zixibacteria bacterium CG_4_9_14_3_um_filter_46_8]